ncbi:SDR family NAD(P)-dependent oxidoreductase [Paraburkholderia phenoliruptrix]|uniref:SDR family NAD(P)-dependent oxidoreductase n=1 Tax=Paraburkholderia phenoliruptrix TaxID=252970 RepID=UPI002869D596|nr:SDR family oxidoreductase [Paraburkholderia phenoliruptrix]WMY11764.1 SDR family NAD(P)-dependent oxidoreductase [Paraburkholderia phenoliruptrix]
MHPAIRKDGVAVITGAAKGLGFAIAELAAQYGMHLALLDSDGPALQDAASRLSQLGTQVTTVAGDVSHELYVSKLRDQANTLGNVALIINSAGITKGAGPWDDVPQWRALMEVNFWSILLMQQVFVPQLIEQGTPSAIVNLGSKEGITTPPGNAAYSVSKAALRVLTEQLAHELRERVANRVTAHLLVPGYTFTPMNVPGMTPDTPKPASMWTADQVAKALFAGLSNGDFYILCQDNEVSRELDERRIQWSADDLIKNRPALSRWHEVYKPEYARFVADVPKPSR